MPPTARRLDFAKVAKYYHYPGWWEGGAQLAAYVSLKAWESLPKSYQAILESACGDAHIGMMAKYDARNPQALKRQVSTGMRLRPFPRPVLDTCYKATQEVCAETYEKNPTFKKSPRGHAQVP